MNQYASAERKGGFWIRLAAILIDLFVVWSMVHLVVSGFAHAGEYLPFELTFIVFFPLYSSLLVGLRGQTVGKALTGLRVNSSLSTVPGYGQAFLRETVFKAVSAAFFFLGFLWTAFSRKKRSWHDYLSRTRVIQDIGALKRANIVLILAIILACILFGPVILSNMLGYYEAAQMTVDPKIKPRYALRDPSTLVEVCSLGENNYPTFIEWLNHNSMDPVEYTVHAVASHQITIFAEKHGVRDNLLFLNRIIPELYHRAGVTCVAMEACNAGNNLKLARLVTAERFDSTLALQIARSTSWPDWGWKEYWDVFETVWRLNRSLPEGRKKMRLLGIDIKIDLPSLALFGAGDDAVRGSAWEKLRFFRLLDDLISIARRDELMAANLEKEIIHKEEKAVVWVGASHAHLHYRRPVVVNGRVIREWGRMGFMLHHKYGDRIFQIRLHDSSFESTEITGLIERIAGYRQNEPFGFEVEESPFESLRDSDSPFFRYQPGVCFVDIAAGYLFLKPIEEQKKCRWLQGYISKEMFAKHKPYYEAQCGCELSGVEEVNRVYSERK